jgi:hypothetical protein
MQTDFAAPAIEYTAQRNRQSDAVKFDNIWCTLCEHEQCGLTAAAEKADEAPNTVHRIAEPSLRGRGGA